MKISAIEIGTNSTKFVLADVQADGSINVLNKSSEVNRLSRGMYKDFRLTAENIESTAKVIENCVHKSEKNGAKLVSVFSTSVLRDAINRNDLIDEVKKRFDLDLEVISGVQEAQLAYLACKGLASNNNFAVIDIGGGSTEVVLSDGKSDIKKNSLDIGTVRLTSMFVKSDPINKFDEGNVCRYVNEILNKVYLPKADISLIGTGGSIKTVAKIMNTKGVEVESYINGMCVDIEQIKGTYNKLKKLSYQERILVRGLEIKRADVILSGMIILLEIMKYACADSITISSQGVIEGFLMEYAHKHCSEV